MEIFEIPGLGIGISLPLTDTLVDDIMKERGFPMSIDAIMHDTVDQIRLTGRVLEFVKGGKFEVDEERFSFDQLKQYLEYQLTSLEHLVHVLRVTSDDDAKGRDKALESIDKMRKEMLGDAE